MFNIEVLPIRDSNTAYIVPLLPPITHIKYNAILQMVGFDERWFCIHQKVTSWISPHLVQLGNIVP